MTKKSKFLEDIISTFRQESSSKSEKDKDLFKENYLFLCEKEEMSLKIVELENKLNDSRLFLGLEKYNKKHEKRRLLEDNKKNVQQGS